VKWPYIVIPEGWQPLSYLAEKPALTETAGEFFDPASGQAYDFKNGQTAPQGWKKLQPIPPHPDDNIINRGGCVLYQPGKEPKLFVDPETGKSVWVKWPYIEIGIGWTELHHLPSEPPGTQNTNEHYDPANGTVYKAGEGTTPPTGWKPLKPVPPHPDWKIISRGGCVYYPPGKEPKLFIDPETGESVWVKWPYIEVKEGWQPISELPASPDKINLALNVDGTTRFVDTSISNKEGVETTDDIETDHTNNFFLSDPARFVAAIISSAYPVTEGFLWNNVFFRNTIGRFNPAIHISPLNYYYSNRETLGLLFERRKNFAALEGAIDRIRGLLFEAFAGGNLKPNSFAADAVGEGYVSQIKSILTKNKGTIRKKFLEAGEKLLELYKTKPNLFKANATIFFHNVVPTGTKGSLISYILKTATRNLQPLADQGLKTGTTIIKGIPGVIGKGLKGLGVLGGVLSTYQLVEDIREGDVASGIGSGLGTATFVLETGATVLGSTAMATGAAVTGAAAAGYAVGTLINDHVLEEDTKSLIGETMVELIDNPIANAREFYGGLLNKLFR
jgi:hypothetical protein